MKQLNGLIIGLIAFVMLIGCQQHRELQQVSGTSTVLPSDLPENIWISQSTLARLDSILADYHQAGRKLTDQDTLGAELYFNHAFDLMSRFSERERTTLQAWARYDSVFRKMSKQYEVIYLSTNEPLEAEEIREDITELEETVNIADSALYGESTVIDSSSGIPLTLNRKVRLAIKYFQTKGRYVFTRWLERSGRYEEMVKRIFREKNLPEELAYLAMIESGFNPRARSYARAVGMWQFISATGKYYGLRHNWWFDERRDVLKATNAAAEHLADLYERFGDWYLALSGYNCNPRKVERNIRRYHTRDFWKLKRLPRQTRNYVPTFLAATIIAENPQKFGFYIQKKKPIEVDSITISESVDLNLIARLTDTTYAFIREINPAVLRWVTPPGIKDFILYLPKGKRNLFKERYANIPDNKKRSWVRHRIRSGETLSTIAQKYHTSMSVIRTTNKLRGNFIRAGKYLLIPVPQNKAAYYATLSAKSRKRKSRHSARSRVTHVAGHKKIVYVVKPGDTLGEIAERYRTRASKIRYWNGLRYGQFIRPKQKLAIWVPENMNDIKARLSKKKAVKKEESGTFYTVRFGDTLWDIAKKYGVSIRELKKMNKMRTSRIRPGDRIKVSKN